MYILLIIVAAALLVMALVLLYCYFRCFYNPIPRPKNQATVLNGEQYKPHRQYMKQLIDDFAALEYEPVEIISHDGLKLFGRYYHAGDDAPLHILCHGYRGSAFRDFAGGSKLARAMGHSMLSIDQRAHGKSEGRTISFGINERYDLIAWVEHMNARHGSERPVIISGVSMGAATVLMASELDLPENVKALIADCPYSSPYAIISKVCADMKMPPRLVMPFICLAAKLIGRFDLKASSAIEAVKNTKIPILLLHGEDDRFVPCQMSREISQNSPLIHFESFPGAGHGLSMIVDEERYTALALDFAEGAIGSAEQASEYVLDHSG